MSARNVKLNAILAIALVLGLLFAAAPGKAMAAGSIVYIDNLQPSWTAPGGGGVFSAYVSTVDAEYVSPGTTSTYDGREAGVIKAGITLNAAGHYDDDGVFAFKPEMTIDAFAALPVNYDVVNETGSNPVWMTIEIEFGDPSVRTDNLVYQHVPTSTDQTVWHNVDAKLGLWQQWTSWDSGVPGTNPLISLAEIATNNSGKTINRAYLRLGMGDSYHGTGTGTIGWVDKVNLGGITYDFVLPQYWYVSPEGLDTNEGTFASPFLTIQKAINSAADNDTINVAAGTYNENLNITKPLTLNGAGSSTVIQVSLTSPVYGIYVKADNVTLKNFKVIGSGNPASGFYAFKIEGSSDLLMEYVEVTQSGRTGVDLNGMTNSTLKNVTATNSVNGNGVTLTDSNYITLDSITTSGNSWGGIAVYTKGTAYPCTQSLVTIAGTNSIAESNPLYASVDTVGCATPVITQSDFPFVMTTSAAPTAYQWYNTTAQQAYGFAQWIEANKSAGFLASAVIKALATNNYYVFPGMSIQAAVDVAVDGDTINVGPGTYTGPITVDKDITLIGANPVDGTNDAVVNGVVNVSAAGATVQNLKVVPGAVTGNAAGIFVSASDVTITGNMVDGMAGDGLGTIKGIHVYSSPSVISNIVLTNNVISNLSKTGRGADGIMVQGSVDTVTVTNNTINTINSAGWAYGIEVTPSSAAPAVSPLHVVIQDNTISTINNVANTGSAPWPGVGVSVDVAGNPAVAANASQVTVIENAFANVPAPLNNKDAGNTLNASPNWFGSITGPVSGTLLGLVDADPWCGNAACTFSVTSNPSGQVLLPIGIDPVDIQAALDSVPEGTKLVLPTGLIHKNGGFNVSVPHTTIILSEGTSVQNDSPCFVVNANYTTITAESIGAVTCVPTDGSNGIDVAAGLTNVIISGIEFSGIDSLDVNQSTGAGIFFHGPATDVQIVDNYFHDLDGSGIVFGSVTNNQGIQGNLFQRLGAVPIVYTGPTLNAEYNSWNQYAIPVITAVDADPATHVDLYLVSSGTPTTNVVVNGQQITYTVRGNLRNIAGASFILNYDTTELNLVSATSSGLFNPVPEKLSVLDTTIDGVIKFDGVSSPAVTGTAQNLYTVVFTAVMNGDAPLTFDPTTDLFSMAPYYGPSTNVYAALLDNEMVMVVDPLALTGLDLYESVNEADWTKVFGTLTGGYTMGIDPANQFEFLDAQAPTVNRTLADGLYPFTLSQTGLPANFFTYWAANGVTGTATGWQGTMWQIINGNLPMFYLKVSSAGTAFDLIDGLQHAGGSDVALRVSGDYPLGTYTFNGSVTDGFNVVDPISVNITFVGFYNVTGTFSMQGRLSRAGVPVSLTGIMNPGPFAGVTIEAISGNLTLLHLITDTYVITTHQERYLDVMLTNNKTMAVSAAKITMSPLELKGGDANDDNVVGLGDATVVGSSYGTGTILSDGDVNFDDKVNIFDLALVGGNYGLTNTVYNTWLP